MIKNRNATYKKVLLRLTLIFAGILCAGFLFGCAKKDGAEEITYNSYLEIPGITPSEISAVEGLQARYAYFIYAMPYSTEAFSNGTGEVLGFSALMCEWLTELFDIPFIAENRPLPAVFEGLQSGGVHFTGTIAPTQDHREMYHMTDPIALRTLRYFRLEGSAPLAEIETPRMALQEGRSFSDSVFEVLGTDSFAPVFITNNGDVYEMLASGQIDAFIHENSTESVFDDYDDVVMLDFFPVVISPVSLTAYMDELEPIISIVQKALENGAISHITELYNQGYNQYLRHKFHTRLSDDELEYINNHIETGTSVAVGLEFDNYPVSFYNRQEQAWQGIAIDVLREIEKHTGLTFERAHDETIGFDHLMRMLEHGDIELLSEVIPTPEREGRFLYSGPYATDYFALISRLDSKDYDINEILSLNVGLTSGAAYTEAFNRWFPGHPNATEYADTITALDALERGDIDVYMGTRKLLLMVTNYLERPGYKLNIIFDYSYSSNLGVNIDEPILHSIVAKAQRMIDVDAIYERWSSRVFDYRQAAAAARLPYLVGFSAVAFLTAVSLLFVFIKSKRLNIILQNAVAERTRELKEQMEIAVSASKSKSDFLAMMSHELRTPMNAIIGISQVQLHKDELPEEYAAAIQRINTSGNHLMLIINDLLDMSKIESGNLELIPINYEIASLINDVVQLNLMRIGSKQLEFYIEADENLPSRFWGDELRLKQILSNLLSNGMKYTEQGYVKLIVNHSEKKNGEMILRFIVEDTGQGMKSEDLEKLFTEYSRFNVEANRTTEGTGLGLGIVKRLVDLMNGTISVESEYGAGSTFTVEVVQRAVKCPVIGKQAAENLRRFRETNLSKNRERRKFIRNIMPYGKVLIVDDVEMNLYVAEAMLLPYKINPQFANSGFETIELIKNGNAYDIIFMDHMMPEMDGIETVKKLREMGYAGIIVALTANAIVGNDELFKRNGFDDFITKPIDVRQLNNVLSRYIHDKHPEEAEKYKRDLIQDDASLD